jgi:hypothetical protein
MGLLMTKYVHWDEPGPDGKTNVHNVITVKEAIRRGRAAYLSQLEKHGWTEKGAAPYNDGMALCDFTAIHWAWINEDPSDKPKYREEDWVVDVFWCVSDVLRHGGKRIPKDLFLLDSDLCWDLAYARKVSSFGCEELHCIREQLVAEYDFAAIHNKLWPR